MATDTSSGSSNGGPVTTGGVQLDTAVPKGFRLKVSQMIAGIQAVIPDGSSVTVGGVTTAKADLVGGLLKISTIYQSIDAGVMAAKGTRSQLKDELPGFRKQYNGVKHAIIAFLGQGNPQLAQFGIRSSGSPTPLTPAQKVVRAAKALKTRALRHTMGKVQKAAVQFEGDMEVAVNQTATDTPANETAPEAASPVTVPAATPAADTALASAPAATPTPSNHTQ